jgi:hypothetical protein
VDSLTRRSFLAGAAAAPLLAADDLRQRTGKLLYETSMADQDAVRDWTMEGPGRIKFDNDWMTMWSPGEEMHHVYWCPKTFPGNFLASWEMQNLHPEAGLCIVFFCATGVNGEDVMDPSLPPRDGTFSQYNRDKLNCYHISYYANTESVPARPVSRLRKNPGANIVHEGPAGIAAQSTDVHKVELGKMHNHILLTVDGRTIIDWHDDGKVLGEAYGAGRIALRQMRWSQFRYRNFRVWELLNEQAQ